LVDTFSWNAEYIAFGYAGFGYAQPPENFNPNFLQNFWLRLLVGMLNTLPSTGSTCFTAIMCYASTAFRASWYTRSAQRTNRPLCQCSVCAKKKVRQTVATV
jgi:hypothetical protein